MESEDVLMRKVAKGDHFAFSQLVNANIGTVMAVARRMLGNESEAEDVTQEVMLRLWKFAPRWKPGTAKVSTWLHRITANLCIDRLRGRKLVALPDDFDEPVEASQEKDLLEKQRAAIMEKALMELPERQRLALVLFHYEDLSMQETANIMEITSEAVQSLLARGRRTLKKILAGDWERLMGTTRNTSS